MYIKILGLVKNLARDYVQVLQFYSSVVFVAYLLL